MNASRKTFLLIQEIGLPSLAAYGSYSIQKKLGKFTSTRLTGSDLYSTRISGNKVNPVPKLHFDLVSHDLSTVFGTPEEISNGLFRPFGGESTTLDFALPQPLKDWTGYSDSIEGKDIKEFWEPARFSWSLTLAGEFTRSRDNKYVEVFWKYFEKFSEHNPCYLGPNWVSAQEVALRAINWLLLFPVFHSSPASTPARQDALVQSLWQHFVRILPTIGYAKSQNNNHLLSESLALSMLGDFFTPQSAFAQKWKRRGKSIFEKTLLSQISSDGTYCQHSTNYHRMMLHLSLIYRTWLAHYQEELPQEVSARLAEAVKWLTMQYDTLSGKVTNLGHNDGTLLLPFGCRDYGDYRPTLQAASLAFTGKPVLPFGSWDDLSNLLGLAEKTKISQSILLAPSPLRIGNETLWASLRAVHFNERPGHADQLHTEIWWDGINIACDAGTYAYNKPAPWQNALMSTRVHNTITIDQKDQMLRAGKFLWLKKAQAEYISRHNEPTLSASHDGYKSLGVRHSRTVQQPGDFEINVTDEVSILNPTQEHLVSIHWLLPDWHWKWDDDLFTIQLDDRSIDLRIFCKSSENSLLPIDHISLVRAGVALLGNNQDDILGWISPTYNLKTPALSLTLSWIVNRSVEITSHWQFRKDK